MQMSNQSNNLTSVTTGQVRLSFVHLFKPYSSKPDQEPKYSATLLIPKSDVATRQRIDVAINAAIQAGVASKWNGIRPPQIAIPIHDGDGPRPSDGMPFGEECRGHWVITASSKQAQSIVDINLNPIINQSEVYSGIYARVYVNFFPFVNSGKKGIGCGLGPVLKIADGEPLGGQMSAEAAFGQGTPVQQNPAPAFQAPAYQQPSYPQPAYQQPPYQAPMQQPNYAAPTQPTYGTPAQPSYGQPNYGAPMQPGYPPQPGYGAPAQIDPITGKPLTGGIMGI